jgi:predicted nuclease of predicted toxin-antitoxin system
MKRKYLIDANLPKYFGLWQKIEAEYVPDTLWSDEKIWQYARDNQLTILTKDADFAQRSQQQRMPPPWVVRLDIGNLRSRVFFGLMHRLWHDIEAICEDPRHLLVVADRLGVRAVVTATDLPKP